MSVPAPRIGAASPRSAASTGAVIITGPVFATFVASGLPCFGCVVPSGKSTPQAYTFGSFEPVGVYATNTKSIEYVVYVQNLSCPASTISGGTNLVFAADLLKGSTRVDHVQVSRNIGTGFVTYAFFNRLFSSAISPGADTLNGTVTCTTSSPIVTSRASVPLYFQ